MFIYCIFYGDLKPKLLQVVYQANKLKGEKE